MIRQLNIKNFKSILKANISLGPFNAIIGPNGSGKSNFIDAIRFLYDSLIFDYDIEQAVYKRLGFLNVINKYSNSRMLYFDILLDNETSLRDYSLNDYDYTLRIKCNNKGDLIISRESLWFNLNNKRTCGFHRKTNDVSYLSELSDDHHSETEVFDLNKTIPFATTNIFSFSTFAFTNIIRSWNFYDINTSLARKSSLRRKSFRLSSDGSNLGNILYNIYQRNDSKAKKIIEYIHSILCLYIPDFKSIETDITDEGIVTYSLLEEDKNNNDAIRIPADAISDGTIKFISILAAGYLSEREPKLICIEEPENNLHPNLYKALIEILKEMSQSTQIIITTHSPRLVDLLEPEEVIMINKKGGNTEFRRATSIKAIRKYLKEFMLGELWQIGVLEQELDW